MKKLFLLLTTIILLNFSCHKNDILPSTGYEEVTLKNLTGLDGCGFVLQKIDSKYLEPTNLGNFIDSFVDGKKYWIKYKLSKDQMSICMIGEKINVVKLSDHP